MAYLTYCLATYAPSGWQEPRKFGSGATLGGSFSCTKAHFALSPHLGYFFIHGPLWL